MPCTVNTSATELSAYQLSDVGVDWLTCFQAGRRSVNSLHDEGTAIALESARHGNDVRERKVLGFYGRQCGGVFVGTRHDGFLCQLSGSDARDNWTRIMPLQTNVTRLDLQVTVTFNEVQKRMIVKAYNRALKAPKVRGRRPEYKLITNSREGDSLYFGRPQSDIVGRMYDKGIESKLAPAGKIVRWEVQMRRDAAKLTAARMMESETPDTLAGASVAEHFRRRQITPPRFEITEVDGARVVSRSDNAGRMAYFRVVVSKMVEKCLTTYTRDEVIEALGLELDDVSSYKQA